MSLLRAGPDGPGRQAALCALGELGNSEAVPFLLQQVDADGGFAYEATLALGKLRDPRAVEFLRRFAADASRDVTTRTAAACALLDLGTTRDAVPLLRAVLLAGTPDGRELGVAHGLPRKTRWALERVLVIDAISRYSGGETFGLDPDSPWPRLGAGVKMFARYVEAREHR